MRDKNEQQRQKNVQDILNQHGEMQKKLKERIGKAVEANPEKASSALRRWLTKEF